MKYIAKNALNSNLRWDHELTKLESCAKSVTNIYEKKDGGG